MFSTMPSTGTSTLRNMLRPLRASSERDVLRRRDDDGAGERHLLRHGELRVAGAGRQSTTRMSSSPQSTSRSICLSALITIGPRQIIGVSSGTRKPIDMHLTP